MIILIPVCRTITEKYLTEAFINLKINLIGKSQPNALPKSTINETQTVPQYEKTK